MTTEQIRETFLEFFAARGHRRLPSASLVPAEFDPSVLLTTAGMHPLKSYFRGVEAPPHARLASCQKCFRTTDIANVGNTLRHLTFFEMLGNFSIGDYSAQEAIAFAWDLAREGFGFAAQDIWVTVFAGDDELGLGPDEQAIAAWEAIGVPRERIVALGRDHNFWQSGPTGPCGPCSELYLDRGLDFGGADDRPGDDSERFLEFWNLVFMQFDQGPANTLTPLPAPSVDTGLGLNRMAVIQQDVASVYETDQFAPLMALGRELATKDVDERALRILADHSRAMTFLLADGVVPSNSDRGHILRRVMRRAIRQGHRIGIEGEGGLFLAQFVEQVIELMGGAYPGLGREHETILRWVRCEEEGFGRTLAQGTKLLEEIVERSRHAGTIPAQDAFRLHHTFGFPFDVTRDLALEQGLEVDTTGFYALVEQQRAKRQRARTRAGERRPGSHAAAEERERALAFARDAGVETMFIGHETLEQPTTVAGVQADGGRMLLKLAQSPFYATGGGQVADAGVLECEAGGCRAVVTDVLRLGDDQALVVEMQAGELKPGERVVARVARDARHATAANHTATHLLHAALRERLGSHVRQTSCYVGPDKLRIDFTHGERISAEDLRAIEDRVNEWVLRNDPVHSITTTLQEARALGAMEVAGETYGDTVRVVSIGDGDCSRELCDGTHVRYTAQIGVVKISREGSSATNIRRIEAITGREAIAALRRADAMLSDAATTLRTRPDNVPDALAALREHSRKAAKGTRNPADAIDAAALAARAAAVEGAQVVTEVVNVSNAKELTDIVGRVKGRLGELAATVIGTAVDGRVHLVAAVTPALVERGVKACAVVKAATQVAGGGGGGRETMAHAGGMDPARLTDTIAAARQAIETALVA